MTMFMYIHITRPAKIFATFYVYAYIRAPPLDFVMHIHVSSARCETAILALLLRHVAPGRPGRHLLLRRGAREQRRPCDAIYDPAGAQDGTRPADDGSRQAHRH